MLQAPSGSYRQCSVVPAPTDVVCVCVCVCVCRPECSFAVGKPLALLCWAWLMCLDMYHFLSKLLGLRRTRRNWCIYHTTERITLSTIVWGRLPLKCDGTRAETRFRLSAKRTSPFKSTGTSFQSTTGSRVVRISVSNAGYAKFRGSVKGTGYPLHSPVSPSLPPHPCVTVCYHVSDGLYHKHEIPESQCL